MKPLRACSRLNSFARRQPPACTFFSQLPPPGSVRFGGLSGDFHEPLSCNFSRLKHCSPGESETYGAIPASSGLTSPPHHGLQERDPLPSQPHSSCPGGSSGNRLGHLVCPDFNPWLHSLLRQSFLKYILKNSVTCWLRCGFWSQMVRVQVLSLPLIN